MTKLTVTYFFSLVLLVSIVAPTYVSLAEGTCEITVADFGEEEENNSKKSVKDFEVKIYYAHDSSSFYLNLEKKKRISFYSKNYTSYQKKLISPPPESLA